MSNLNMTTNTEAQYISEEMYEIIQAKASRSYRRHQGSIRGQMLSAADTFDWHLINYAYYAGQAAERERCANLAADLSADAARYRYLQSIAVQTADPLGPVFSIDIRRIDQDGVWSNVSATIDAHIADKQSTMTICNYLENKETGDE